MIYWLISIRIIFWVNYGFDATKCQFPKKLRKLFSRLYIICIAKWLFLQCLNDSLSRPKNDNWANVLIVKMKENFYDFIFFRNQPNISVSHCSRFCHLLPLIVWSPAEKKLSQLPNCFGVTKAKLRCCKIWFRHRPIPKNL